MPIAKLPLTDHRKLDPAWDDPEFIARQVAVLEARRRAGMNLIVKDDDGRILRIAPDGTETDVTAELDRRIFEETVGRFTPAP